MQRWHAINALLATSCVWCSMLYSPFKIPKNGLLFLKFLPIALIIRESLSSLLLNRDIQRELSVLHPKKIFLVAFWNSWVQTKCYISFKTNSYFYKTLPSFLLSFCQHTSTEHLLYIKHKE